MTNCKRCELPVTYDEKLEGYRTEDGSTGCADLTGNGEVWRPHDPVRSHPGIVHPETGEVVYPWMDEFGNPVESDGTITEL